MEKPHWVMDYETMINCFIAVFEHYKKDERLVFVVHEQRNDFPEFVSFLNKCVKDGQWHISFNGLGFDAQVTQHILNNQAFLLNSTPEAIIKFIYDYAQSVIEKNNKGDFADYAPYKLKIKQIDLFKLNHWDNKAKMSSLKWVQYSMDWDNVEEMPHPHYEPVTDSQTLENVINYCINDVQSTKKVFEHSKEQIALRQNLTKEYGIDLYSASEPRISKELFLYFLEQRTGIPKSQLKTLRTPRPYIVLADCILPYVKFDTPEFNKVLDYFRTKVITSTKDGFKYSFNFKGVKTDYGLGGIHGAAPSGVYEAKPGWTIMTSDVTSYYPNLAIKNKFAPEHLPKQEFCELYEWVFEERKKIPKTDPKNYVYKLILNSTYGLTGDENSFLYDPRMTMQITINGQLLLSKLAEMLSLAIPECQPLMLNTDGLEMMIPEDKVAIYYEICSKWQTQTQLSLEHDQYSKMIIRDVNNYMAITIPKQVKDDKDGTLAKVMWEKMKKKSPSYLYFEKDGNFFYQATKCKGAFEWEDLAKKKVAIFHKNKSFLIIPKAIYAWFVHGTKPEDFLAANKDIYDYCGAVKAKGGWYFEDRRIVDGDIVNKKLQKIVRYFVSNDGGKIVKCHQDGREIQVEAGQWLQTVVNKIDDSKDYDKYDINLKYYLEEIYKQIDGIQTVSFNKSVQLSLF